MVLRFTSPPPSLSGSRAKTMLGVFRPVRDRNVFRRPRYFVIPVALSLQSFRFAKSS